MWTPWGPGEVSCIERCPHFRATYIYIKKTLLAKYPKYKSVLISGMAFKTVHTMA